MGQSQNSESNRVFISYNHRDQQWVREFVDKLLSKGINVWVDEKEIAVGESIADKLEEGLRSSSALVFILDSENIHSSNMFFELGAALGAGKRIIAIVDKDVPVNDLPPPIRQRRYLLRESPQESARDVVAALASIG